MGGWKLKLGRHYKEGTPSVSFRVLYNEPPILCVGQSLSCVTPWLCLPTSYVSSNAAGFRSGTDTHTPWHTFPITVTHRTGTRTCKQTERAEMWLYSQITVWKRCRVYITVVWIHSWTPTYHTLKKKINTPCATFCMHVNPCSCLPSMPCFFIELPEMHETPLFPTHQHTQKDFCQFLIHNISFVSVGIVVFAKF